MTATTAAPRVGADQPTGPQRVNHEGGRLARWRSSWRLGMIMAWRDARRYRGRSVLIMLMIGLPVLILVGGLTLLATADVSSREALPTTLGGTVAKIIDPRSADAINQDPEAGNYGSVDGSPARTIPGHTPGSEWTAEEIGAVTQGTALPVAYANSLVKAGDRWHGANLIIMTGADLVRADLGRIERGRFPDQPGELAVTTEGLGRGLPEQGPVSVRLGDGSNADFTVVGVVQATGPSYGPLDGVSTDPRIDRMGSSFLIDRSTPVEWFEVRQLNAYGLAVLSRAVVENPPAANQLDAQLSGQSSGYDGAQLATIALAVVALVAETTLLAGPAFAVSAARRRRSLALAAVNGAERHQIRQYVLAQALVLGGVAAVIGAVLGLVGAQVVVAGVRWSNSGASLGPFQTQPLLVLGVVALALGASGVAALVPARGSGRLEMTEVLAGRSSAGPVRRSYPVVGLVMVVVGGSGSILAMLQYRTTEWVGYLVGVAALVVLTGAILTVPAVLSGLVPVLARFGLAVRIAARDSVRQRSRAVPAVAAIMVATAGITALGISQQSTDARAERTYTPTAVSGQGVVGYTTLSDGADTLAEIRRQQPDWTMWPRAYLGSIGGYEGTTGRQPTVGLVAAGCTATEAVQAIDDDDRYVRCHRVGNDSVAGEIAVADLALADPAADLTADQQRVLRAGGILAVDGSLVEAGRVTVAIGGYDAATPEDVALNRTLKVPAAEITVEQLARALPGDRNRWGGWVLPSTAVQLQLPTTLERTEVVAPGGSIAESAAQAINDRVDPSSQIYVERGYQPPSSLIILVMFGVAGLLVLVAAMIATALGQAESRGDLATLAALGSTVGLRRRLAAAQAVLVALLGTVLGIVVGLPVGISAAIMSTGYARTDGGSTLPAPPVIAMPWLGFAILLTVVPLLAILVAALGVRRVPPMTRRVD